MLSLSKKTDYALIALAYLAERPSGIASAREIAAARNLPAALLMNILKELHHIGIVRSTRGSQGGYELAIDPSTISLHDLIVAMQGPVKLVECAGEATPCTHDNIADADACRVSGHCAVQAPLQALNDRLVRFLQDVQLSDVILAASPDRAK
jgi:Rrf2 family protein